VGPKSTSQIQSSNPVVPTVEVGDPDPALEISRILEAQARMQQEFTEYKKRNADEMEALREENSRLRQKIEADNVVGEPYPTHSRIDVPPTMDDTVLCKSFSVALRGSALEWFMSLPSYTIDSFTTLTIAFTTQFDTSRRDDLTTIALLNLRQEEGEPLRTFIDRFGAIAMKIKDLTPNLILT